MRTWQNLALLWTRYSACPFGVRVRVVIRFFTCPFELFLKAVPKAGRVLDVGCGDGQLPLWLIGEQDSQRQALGIDFDEQKILYATRAAIPDAEFRCQDITPVPSESVDAVCIAHVLYLIPQDEWHGFLRQCFRVLKKGGILVIMEVVDHGSWKSRLAHLQELISVYVTRMTKGKVVTTWPSDTYRDAIEKAGGHPVHVACADQGFLHPHVLFTVHK